MAYNCCSCSCHVLQANLHIKFGPCSPLYLFQQCQLERHTICLVTSSTRLACDRSNLYLMGKYNVLKQDSILVFNETHFLFYF